MKGSTMLLRAVRVLIAAVALTAAPALQAAGPSQGIGVATIVDGEATLLRLNARLQFAEGVRVVAGDIVETGPAARLLRLELADGLLLDLGASTRLQITPRLTGDPARRAARLYLLRGWAKLTATRTLPDGIWLASPAVDLRSPKGSVVIALDGADTFVFAESGEQALLERSSAVRLPNPMTLKAGEFYSRRGDAKANVAAKPSAVFVQKLPKAFLDSLAARLQKYAPPGPEPKPLGNIAYADAQPWIDAEQALRTGFMLRWRSLARQPAFRQGLLDNLAAHPEWEPVLHPEKFTPAGASGPGSVPVSPGSPPTPLPTR